MTALGHPGEPDGASGSAAPDGDLPTHFDAHDLRRRDSWSWADRIAWLLTGRRREPVPAVLGIAGPSGGYGICCSGGGIRSAAFNLGALQVLQRERVLQEARYLSAVSGGSYIAAGWAMVSKTNGPDDSVGTLLEEQPPFAPGSPEEQYLRNRSAYMAPGALGKLRLAARIVLGLLVNLLVLGALLTLVGWALGGLYGELYEGLRTPAEQDFNARTWPFTLATGAIGAIGLVIGLSSALVRPGRDAVLAALRTWSARLLALGATGFVALVALPELLEWVRDVGASGDARRLAASQHVAERDPWWLALLGGGSAISALLGVLLQLREGFGKAPAPARYAVAKAARAVAPRARRALIFLAATAAGPLLFVAAVLAAAAASLAQPPGTTSWWIVLGALGALAAVLYASADLTTWSLHPFYKRRLCSAFALKRVWDPDADAKDRRVVARERDYDTHVKLSESAVEPGAGPEQASKWPLLVVCAAANVSDIAATPPGRSVTSFTFSARTIGGPLVGTVGTKKYENALPSRGRDFTLPAAVAVSGAAVSPSMGKETRGAARFLLALANVRLGVWLPNPRRIEDFGDRRSYRRALGRPRPSYLLRELLGRNLVNARFVYVTDGGHYENLGLVELLRRGCRDVLCFDASGGTSLQALGDAIAIARSELQVQVDVPPEQLEPLRARDGMARDMCAVGTIRHPDGTEGQLVYVRSLLTEKAPWDVRAYHERDPAFPHNPTMDQLYTDQRFEAYRTLGTQAGERALQRWRQAPEGPSAAGDKAAAPPASSANGRVGAVAAAVRLSEAVPDRASA